MNDDLLEVALIGKSVGLKGYLRLHNRSDFLEQFKEKAQFYDKFGNVYEIENFDKKNLLVKFVGFDDANSAKKLTNLLIFATKQSTIKNCKLKNGEYFYFDIIGLKVIENGVVLGVVDEICYIGLSHLFLIKTDENLVKSGLPKQFYIPYNDHFISKIDISSKTVVSQNAFAILENS